MVRGRKEGNRGVAELLFCVEDLGGVGFGLYLFGCYYTCDASFGIYDEGCAEGAHVFASVHGFLSPHSKGFKQFVVGIGN